MDRFDADGIIEAAEFRTKLEAVLRNAAEALGGGAGIIALWGDRERRFVRAASFGLDAKALKRLSPLLDEAIPDLAVSRRSFDRISKLLPHAPLPSTESGLAQDPVMALPLVTEGKVAGLILVLRPWSADTFATTDQRVLAGFAEQAAIAVENARLVHELAREKRRLESIVENSAEGIWSINWERRITGFNATMEKLTGWHRDEVLHRYCYDILPVRDGHGKELCQILCPLARAGDEPRSVVEVEGPIKTKDGQSLEVARTYAVMRSPKAELLGAVINLRDITRLREVENLRSTLLSAVSHQLQTPISIIKGYANILARRDARWDRGTLRQGLRVIEEEGDRLSKLVNNLLRASRIDTGELSLEKEPVELPKLVQRVVRRLRVKSDIHRFEVKFPLGFPTVMADPQGMEEVLINLIDNAMKYSPAGGKVSIEGRVSGEEVVVSVADDGIGLSMRDKELIFQRFYRVEGPLFSKVPGVGLGLFICQSIVNAHGGKIEVVSQAGKGSCFTFTLPLG